VLRQQGGDVGQNLDRLPDRLGHVSGELLPTFGTQAVRLVSFDDDPNVEFEIGSSLVEREGGATLEVTIRVEYELVVRDPSLHYLLEQRGAALIDMRRLSRERADVQKLASAFQQQLIEMRSLAAELDHNNKVALASLQRLEQSLDQLVRRSFWSVIRRIVKRG